MRLRPILLSLALLCASGPLLAVEGRQMDADGGGSCPESAAAANDDAEQAGSPATPARRTQKAKPAPASRGGAAAPQRSSAPRWHSFLPGMFR